jgi:hypothetical protein
MGFSIYKVFKSELCLGLYFSISLRRMHCGGVHEAFLSAF